MSYIPVMLQRLDTSTETWADVKKLHALQVNSPSGKEGFGAGAEQYHVSLKFRFAWSPLVEQVRFSPQTYRLIYRDQPFNIVGYDDYMEQHVNAVITGEAYG